MSRVRTGIKPGEWRDDGPCPEVSRNRGRNDPWVAEPIGDMIPLIAGTVLSSYSNGHHGRTGATQAFSINPENRWAIARPVKSADGQRRPHEDAPRCGVMMRFTKQPCARLVGHKTDHRSKATLDAASARKRKHYPSRVAA